LSGGGRLQGSGRLRDSELALRLAVTSLDASALYSSLRRTQLAGPLRATLAQISSDSKPNCVMRSSRSTARLAIHPDEITVETLRLLAGDASLLASGKVALVDSGKFAVQGKPAEFRPQPFRQTAGGAPQCRARGQGSSQSAARAGLRFQLKNSRFGKVKSGRQRRNRSRRAAAAQGRCRADLQPATD
jgi:hypothetical protein